MLRRGGPGSGGPERAQRRQYPASYMPRVLAEYDRLDREGKGVLLRWEGLYTSLISEWRKQRDRGALEALSAKAGRPAADPLERENVRLRRENQHLSTELDKARKVIDPASVEVHVRRLRPGQRARPPRPGVCEHPDPRRWREPSAPPRLLLPQGVSRRCSVRRTRPPSSP